MISRLLKDVAMEITGVSSESQLMYVDYKFDWHTDPKGFNEINKSLYEDFKSFSRQRIP